jgi:pyridoxamine 5'-phosphate oxidase
MTNVAELRREYKLRALTEGEALADPIAQFAVWFDEAIKSEIVDVNAMALATASATGAPSVRTVLLKDFSERGFVFFTNYESAKGHDLDVNPRAELLFFWKELERQIRIGGTVTKVSREESEAYFHSRPLDSQISVWASPQSREVADRGVLEDQFTSISAQYANQTVPLPSYWGGYRVTPGRLEFWQGRAGRLHDRLLYVKSPAGWTRTRLAP